MDGDSVLATAKEYVRAGLSVLPVHTDGSKAPTCTWGQLQEHPADEPTLERMFAEEVGVGIVCGAVSRNLEVVDCESSFQIRDWAESVKSHPGGEELLQKLPVVRTPTGSWHLYYRCKERIEGNQKLAQKYVVGQKDGVRPKTKVLAETRGEGGYVIAPGSPPECHLDGKPYVLVRGDLTTIPSISAEERLLLLDTARSFDEAVTPKAAAQQFFCNFRAGCGTGSSLFGCSGPERHWPVSRLL